MALGPDCKVAPASRPHVESIQAAPAHQCHLPERGGRVARLAVGEGASATVGCFAFLLPFFLPPRLQGRKEMPARGPWVRLPRPPTVPLGTKNISAQISSGAQASTPSAMVVHHRI